MPVLVKGGKSVLFIHIPKAGGSSFEAHAAEAGWQEVFSVRGVHADRLRAFRATPQHMHAVLLEQVFDLNRFDAILTLVRHPFDRIKSEYYWQRAQGITTAAPAQWWSDMRAIHSDDPCALDNHLRSQRDFLVRSDRLQTFRLEDGMANALRALPGWGLMDKARASLRKRAKASTYDHDTEAAFAKLRPEIEDWYAGDMDRLGYETAREMEKGEA